MTDFFIKGRNTVGIQGNIVQSHPIKGLSQSQLLDGWKQIAPYMINTTMKMKKITYKDLEMRLKMMGVHESAARLNRKVNRQSFSASFFFICMNAMDITELPVPTTQQVIQQFILTKK